MLSATALTMASSALVGLSIAPDDSLATLPLGICYLSVMVALVPASLLMQRFGRKAGFLLGAASGVIGGSVCGFAIYSSHFLLFCIGAGFQGLAMASAQFYRFAAAELADDDYRSRAISWVLAGGLVAAFSGPAIARYTRDFWDLPLFTLSFSSIALLSLGIMVCLAFIQFPESEPNNEQSSKRSLFAIFLVPGFFTAVLCAMIAYGTMNLLMVSTPLAMDHHGMGFDRTASIIQWHIVGMFAPSFFTGHLIDRFGVLKIMACGVVMLLLCVYFSTVGQEFSHFMLGLVALGVGWNFLYIGGTTLLICVYKPEEKGFVQGFNDLLVFSAVATTAFISGYLHHSLGWANLNLATIPALAFAAASIIGLAVYNVRRSVRYGSG